MLLLKYRFLPSSHTEAALDGSSQWGSCVAPRSQLEAELLSLTPSLLHSTHTTHSRHYRPDILNFPYWCRWGLDTRIWDKSLKSTPAQPFNVLDGALWHLEYLFLKWDSFKATLRCITLICKFFHLCYLQCKFLKDDIHVPAVCAPGIILVCFTNNYN